MVAAAEYRIRQVVKITLARFALIVLYMDMNGVLSVFYNLFALAMRAINTIIPPNATKGFKTLPCIQ
jgi:hypothetical protein